MKKLILQFAKFPMQELFDGLELYANMTERQLQLLQEEQRVRLGSQWSVYEEVFTESLPTNLRYSVIVSLITNVEWSVNYAVGLLKKQGVVLPRKSGGGSDNAHKIAFLHSHVTPLFNHPFQDKFEAINVLRNAIVHNAGKPDQLVRTTGPFDIHLFKSGIEVSANKLQPFVILGATNLWIEAGATSIWIQEARDWLSDLYEALKLDVSIELPVSG